MVSTKSHVDGGGLVILTQGSTKVFKRRRGRPALDDTTKQRLHVTIGPKSFLLLLPDSLSPFRDSKYAQSQRFVIPQDGSSSLMVLDWVNSGRGQDRASGEEVWSMRSYISMIEVLMGETLLLRERLVLGQWRYDKGVDKDRDTPCAVSCICGQSSLSVRISPG